MAMILCLADTGFVGQGFIMLCLKCILMHNTVRWLPLWPPENAKHLNFQNQYITKTHISRYAYGVVIWSDSDDKSMFRHTCIWHKNIR